MNYKYLGSTLELPVRRKPPAQGIRHYNFGMSISWVKSQDSVVGSANGYGLEDRGVRVRVPVE
jgi:hypothetical protein